VARNLLRNGVDVYFGYGFGETETQDDSDAVKALTRLAEEHPNFVFRRFGDTHAKVLICDDSYAIVTSFNWLSFGICIDADGAVWYADVPNKRCVRVREGGDVLDTVDFDRGGFACALGGPDRQTLYIVATEWNGPENMFKGEKTGQLLTVPAPAAAAGWPGR
jgi:hypothetical protein